MTPEQIAADVVNCLSFSSNRMVNGRLVGEQHFAYEAIVKAIREERERCAMIAHNMAHALIAKRVTNRFDRHASDQLVRCRDKIRKPE